MSEVQNEETTVNNQPYLQEIEIDRRIKSIEIQWIQSIRYLKLDFDKKVTRIAGKNASGKSAVRKSLSLFSGIYKRGEIKGLIANNRPKGEDSQVIITFFNGEKLTAIIGNTAVVMYHHTSASGEHLKTWQGMDDEILSIMGWKTIGMDTKTSLDVKNNKKNLLIDTTPRENAEMADDLYRNVDVELRIDNLEERKEEINEELKTMKMKTSQYYTKAEETSEYNLSYIENLKETMEKLDEAENFLTLDTMNLMNSVLGYQISISQEIETLLIMNEGFEIIEKIIELQVQQYRENELIGQINEFLLMEQMLEFNKAKINQNRVNQIEKSIIEYVNNKDLLSLLAERQTELNIVDKVRYIEKIMATYDDLDVCESIKTYLESITLFNNSNYLETNLVEINQVDIFKNLIEMAGQNIQGMENRIDIDRMMELLSYQTQIIELIQTGEVKSIDIEQREILERMTSTLNEIEQVNEIEFLLKAKKEMNIDNNTLSKLEGEKSNLMEFDGRKQFLENKIELLQQVEYLSEIELLLQQINACPTCGSILSHTEKECV